MNRRNLITVMAGALVFPALGAFAQDVGAGIVAQLRAQGYTEISVETTWLGRIRIVALRGGGHREIIANPRTGEILRDVWSGASGGTRTTILDDVDDGTASSGGSSGSGSSGSGSDDGSDDNGDDDSGGSHGGSDNSGSGSSGSGKDDSGKDDSGKDDSDDDKSDDSDDDSGKDDN